MIDESIYRLQKALNFLRAFFCFIYLLLKESRRLNYSIPRFEHEP